MIAFDVHFGVLQIVPEQDINYQGSLNPTTV